MYSNTGKTYKRISKTIFGVGVFLSFIVSITIIILLGVFFLGPNDSIGGFVVLGVLLFVILMLIGIGASYLAGLSYHAKGDLLCDVREIADSVRADAPRTEAPLSPESPEEPFHRSAGQSAAFKAETCSFPLSIQAVFHPELADHEFALCIENTGYTAFTLRSVKVTFLDAQGTAMSGVSIPAEEIAQAMGNSTVLQPGDEPCFLTMLWDEGAFAAQCKVRALDDAGVVKVFTISFRLPQ